MQAPAVHVQIREVSNGLHFRVDFGAEQFTGTPDGQAAAAIGPLLDRLQATSHEVVYVGGAKATGTCRRDLGSWASAK